MIVDRSLMNAKPIEIDLSSSAGNAFVLLAYADDLGRKLGFNRHAIKIIKDNMILGDYDHLLKVFDYHFGDYVILYK